MAAFCDRRVPLKWTEFGWHGRGFGTRGYARPRPGSNLVCADTSMSRLQCTAPVGTPAGKLVVGWPLVGLPLDCGVYETLIRVAALLG